MLYPSTSRICRWIIPAHGGIPRFMKAEVPGVTPVAVGKRLRLTQEAVGLTAQEFGRRAGISKSAMSNIMTGRNFPTIPNLVALCEAHDITLEWVCAGFYKGLRHELVQELRILAARKSAPPVPPPTPPSDPGPSSPTPIRRKARAA
jgi:transcriptional regulator with XRE-family HTH domain